MAVDAIVRVSFESDTPANQAANSALVGHPQNRTGEGPFEKVGTAVYSCSNANELQVARALEALGVALASHAQSIDFVSISLVRKEPTEANDA